MPEQDIQVVRHPLFRKDLKRLTRKYRTLSEDLELFEKALLLAHLSLDVQLEAMGFFPISAKGLEDKRLFIGKKFACRAIPGGSRSGIRVVYRIDEDCIRLLYIEMFHKKEKALPNLDRIRRILREDTRTGR